MTATTAPTRRATTPAAPGSRPLTAAATWRDRGACVGQPAQQWDDDATPEQQRKAREACLSCPVFAECLQDAAASEGGYDFGRSHIKAGLSGRDRDWLYRYSRKHGPYDAEEARLLALEARVSGRKVKEIAAREGVEGVTVPLAARLLAGLVVDETVAGPSPQVKVGACEKALQRIDDILIWREERVSLEEIGRRLGVSRSSVTHALKKHLAGAGTARQSGRFLDEEIPAVVERRRRGVTWAQMDVEAGVAEGTTYQRMCRWRRDAEKRGVSVPRELAREIHKLTRVQVVRVRERAEQGVADADQAMELGVSRQQVMRIVTGECYRNFGGPIRAAKEPSVQPCEASRVLFNGAQAGFVKAS